MALTKVIGNGLGAVTQDGGATFNEGSADVDFRVEGNISGDTHALFVEGSSGNSGIFTANGLSAVSSDAKMLQINGSYFIHYDNDAKGTTSVSNNMFFDGSNNKNLYTGEASQYYQNSGSHYWRTAASANAGSTISPSIVMKIDATGAVTKPLQPAFQVHPASTQSNIPVNGFTTIVFGTERFDQNGDFASNTFTAPVTGKYLLSTNFRLDALDEANNNIQLHLTTSNKQYYSIISPNGFDVDPSFWWLGTTVLADMDASDTAYVRMYISQDGTAQMDISADSYFSGHLVC